MSGKLEEAKQLISQLAQEIEGGPPEVAILQAPFSSAHSGLT